MSGNVLFTVHCHLCPLKDFCSFSAADASWRWHNNRYSWTSEIEVEVARLQDSSKLCRERSG